MIGRYSFCSTEADNERRLVVALAYVVNTSGCTGEFCVPTWKAELRIRLAVAFDFADFHICDVN